MELELLVESQNENDSAIVPNGDNDSIVSPQQSEEEGLVEAEAVGVDEQTARRYDRSPQDGHGNME